MSQSEETLQEFLEKNRKIVASWPEWKRNIKLGEPTEEALRILRNYDRLRYEERTKSRTQESSAKPISKKEPQTVVQNNLLTRVDQLQMELDQEDLVLESKIP